MMRSKRPHAPKLSGESRGGIRKRTAGAGVRTDRDGDLDMESAKAGSGRIAKKSKDATSRSRSGHVSRKHGSAVGSHEEGHRERKLGAIQKVLTAGGAGQATVKARRDVTGHPTGPVEISVRGWRDSQGALDPDGGVGRLLAFIEKKATQRNQSKTVKILQANTQQSRKQGDALILTVAPDDMVSVKKLNGFDFLGSKITIAVLTPHATTSSASAIPRLSGQPSQSSIEIKQKLTLFLGKRYNPATRVLDLSSLATDPDLMAMGMFGNRATQTKHFTVLMVVCEQTFESSAKRKEAIQSVSLAANGLHNVNRFTMLAQTFPDLLNLDLSNNEIKTISDLTHWRWKFRDLDYLDLSNNPISSLSDFKDTMMRWYPKLRVLNKVSVRTTEEVAILTRTPIPVVGPNFVDEGQIAENFIRGFFVGYDSDRENVLRSIYSAQSTFSYNVNTVSPKNTMGTGGENLAGWEAYIRRSRNLTRCSHLPTRMNRCFTGANAILDIWKSLPPTRHPDIAQSPQDWLIECHPLPGLPDFSAQRTPSGVCGLIITVHGKYDELDAASGQISETRSFDRVFVLGPGTGLGGLAVYNDMLTVRAYGGNEAWVPEGGAPASAAAPAAVPAPMPAREIATGAAPAVVAPSNGVAGVGPSPQAPDGFGMPLPGKSETQLAQEQAVLQVSYRTKMTLEYSKMALTGNNWDVEAALKNFEVLKHKQAR
ncbi:nuclear mRNA export, poly(A)+RNA binding protein [Ascosphaera acerosa]|nr:nuclear mRNA export, poly(A)+RNA binding protein [Ascosphaera acerosa]